MPLTSEQMDAAEDARRLLADQGFDRALNRLTATAAEIAVFAESSADREANRQIVLTIARIRELLRNDVEAVKLAAEADKMEKAFE